MKIGNLDISKAYLGSKELTADNAFIGDNKLVAGDDWFYPNVKFDIPEIPENEIWIKADYFANVKEFTYDESDGYYKRTFDDTIKYLYSTKVQYDIDMIIFPKSFNVDHDIEICNSRQYIPKIKYLVYPDKYYNFDGVRSIEYRLLRKFNTDNIDTGRCIVKYDENEIYVLKKSSISVTFYDLPKDFQINKLLITNTKVFFPQFNTEVFNIPSNIYLANNEVDGIAYANKEKSIISFINGNYEGTITINKNVKLSKHFKIHKYNLLDVIPTIKFLYFDDSFNKINQFTNYIFDFEEEHDVSGLIRKGTSKSTLTFNIYTDNLYIVNTLRSITYEYTIINLYHLDRTPWE